MNDESQEHILTAAAILGELLKSRGWYVTTAESCTGGWIAKCLTDVVGSSDWFECSVVSYSNRIKSEILGVNCASLDDKGAVSEAVVREMAKGIKKLSTADVSVAVSGVAGPGGGSNEKPVGTVWFCWQIRDRIVTQCCLFNGDREQIRLASVEHAIDRLVTLIQGDSISE